MQKSRPVNMRRGEHPVNRLVSCQSPRPSAFTRVASRRVKGTDILEDCHRSNQNKMVPNGLYALQLYEPASPMSRGIRLLVLVIFESRSHTRKLKRSTGRLICWLHGTTGDGPLHQPVDASLNGRAKFCAFRLYAAVHGQLTYFC